MGSQDRPAAPARGEPAEETENRVTCFPSAARRLGGDVLSADYGPAPRAQSNLPPLSAVIYTKYLN